MHHTLKDEERFWSKVDRRNKDECWNWLAGVGAKGYGVFFLNQKSLSAHRFSYKLKTGVEPEGLLVCHTCDNPVCVNPNHLFAGTNTDNMRDKVKKNRCNAPRGERHGNHKLTADKVVQIRKLAGLNTLENIAKQFNISFQHVSDIINKRKWAWLGDK